MRFVTLDPGHFHAALVHKEMYEGVSPNVAIYAPVGPDLIDHLKRIVSFNGRPADPTRWELDIHAGPDFLRRMLADRPGDVVVISGRNRPKIERIKAAVDAGLHVLADKPWIIRSEELPLLQEVLEQAEARGLVAYDIMTERFEITSMVLKELVNDPEVFGRPLAGSPDAPAVAIRSVHHIMKVVAGAALRRSVWFFDIHEQGEALADVGTHLVDMVPWTLFPEQPIDHRTDLAMHSAKRWPTVLTSEQFREVVGEDDFPPALAEFVRDGRLEFFCNTRVAYALRGIHVRLDVLWDTRADDHGDTHDAIFRGDRAAVEVRQTAVEKYRPETYVVPNDPADAAGILKGVRGRVAALGRRWPGLEAVEEAGGIRIAIPDALRVGHEAHFAQVTRCFLNYLKNPKALPSWEKANMLAKYAVSTAGTDLSRA